VAFAVGLNFTLGQLTSLLKIPLYLDSIGTVLVGALCGPWAGAIAGTMSNLVAGAILNPSMIFFIPVSIVIGIFSAYVARWGWFKKIYLTVLGGLLQGLIAAVISAPISAYFFSGVMMAGTDFLVIYFRTIGNSLLQSVYYQALTSDPADKLLTYLIVFFLFNVMPFRLLSRFRGGMKVYSGRVE
jgi:energy-coupling factor transport system substrate-specific component